MASGAGSKSTEQREDISSRLKAERSKIEAGGEKAGIEQEIEVEIVP